MIDKHRIENEEWINARRQELEEERKQLELEKVMRWAVYRGFFTAKDEVHYMDFRYIVWFYGVEWFSLRQISYLEC